jgi:DNA repair ATPase RecN
MGPSLQSLEDQYMLLSQKLSTILLACTTQAERDQVMAQYIASRRNYVGSIQKVFHNDDPQIAALVQQMQTEQQQIKDSINHLNDIAKVINILGEAVNVGTALAAKVA